MLSIRHNVQSTVTSTDSFATLDALPWKETVQRCLFVLIKGLLSWWGGKKRAPHEGSCAVHICKTHQFIPVCWLSESGSVILLTANSNDSSAQCHVSHFIKMDLWNEGVCIFLVLRDFTLHYSCTPNEQCESLFSFWTFFNFTAVYLWSS